MPRAVVFDQTGAPDVLRIVDEPATEPAAAEVRIRIEAIGLNRLDQMMRAGTYPGPVRLPRARLGCEGTGVIDAVGPEVDGFAVGDPVLVTAVPQMDVNGTYAEYVTMPAATVVARPAGLDAVGAAALWVAYSTAYGALVEKAGMRPGDHVLVNAASSSVGLAAIQVALQIGAVPLAVTRHAAKRDALLAAGAAGVIVTDEEDVVAGAHRLTGGAGADVVLDLVRGPGLAELARAAGRGRTVVTAGWMDDRPASFPTGWPVTVISYASFEHTTDPAAVRRIAAFLGAGLRTGVLRPVVDRVFALDDIVEAHRYLEAGGRVGKIVVTV